MRGFATRTALLVMVLVTLMLVLNAGQALATHVGCGDEITEDTKLDSDLIGCHFGIRIGASGVTLDLNNHLIEGQGGEFSQGIRIAPPSNGVTIENGDIRGFRTGVVMLFSNDNVVRDLNVADTGTGIAVDVGDRNTIERNRVVSDVEGISLLESNRNIVARNSVSGGPFNAITLFSTDGSTVTANSVSGASLRGILLVHTTNALVERNKSSENGDGILVFPEDRSAGEVLLRDNVVRRNLDDGIDIESSGVSEDLNVTLSSNKAHQNADLGIEAAPGVTDGGGNKANHNGNPLQCLNVVCK
jgi:parallel beta-helix repeat protein